MYGQKILTAEGFLIPRYEIQLSSSFRPISVIAHISTFSENQTGGIFLATVFLYGNHIVSFVYVEE